MKGLEKEGEKYTFFDGDVYVVDNNLEIYIWLGKDSSTDEKTVGAWIANKLDNTDRGGEPKVMTVNQGEEPEEFKSLIQFEVVDDDTPGFLRHAELDMVEYKLFRVYTKTETAETDEVFVEEVPMERSSLKSDDVFVLDGNESLFIWIGSSANREEKYEGQKLLQKIDSTRNYLPLQYTIYEGEGGKSENGFYEFLEQAKSSGPVVSVEDKRETEYVPEQAQTVEEHKTETDQEYSDADPSQAPEKVMTTADIPSEEKDTMDAAAVKKAAEIEAAKKAIEEEAARKKAEEEAARKKAEEEAARKKAEEEAARKKAEEEAARKKAEEEAARKKAEEEAVKTATPSGDIVKLYFVDGEFVESSKNAEKAQAVIEISKASENVKLTFPPDASLITRRTASRQAESVARSGFLLSSGERVAVGYDFEVVDADKLSEAHFRVGHSYNK